MNDIEQLIVNAIAISRVVSDELKGNESYTNIVKIADELKLTPYQVTQFLQLYNKAQTLMLI